MQDRHGDVVDVHCGVEGELDAHRLLSVLPADPTVTFIYIYNSLTLILFLPKFHRPLYYSCISPINAASLNRL